MSRKEVWPTPYEGPTGASPGGCGGYSHRKEAHAETRGDPSQGNKTIRRPDRSEPGDLGNIPPGETAIRKPEGSKPENFDNTQINFKVPLMLRCDFLRKQNMGIASESESESSSSRSTVIHRDLRWLRMSWNRGKGLGIII